MKIISRTLFCIFILFIVDLYLIYRDGSKPLQIKMELENLNPGVSKIGDMQISTYRFPAAIRRSSKVIFLAILNNAKSYGGNRKIADFIGMVINQIPKNMEATFGILVSDEGEAKRITDYVANNQLPFSKVTVIQDNTPEAINRENRKADNVQKARRRMLAVLRNTLAFIAIADEDHVVWIDVDINFIPNDLTKKFIDSGRDIVVPRCLIENSDSEYDLNTWVGKRGHPSPEEIEGIKKGELFVPYHAGAKFLSDFKKSGQEFVEIDSVGGTMLYSKAEIYRKGVNFPPLYIVGTDWDMQEGWDGIESEGFCYVAKVLGHAGPSHKASLELKNIRIY